MAGPRVSGHSVVDYVKRYSYTDISGTLMEGEIHTSVAMYTLKCFTPHTSHLTPRTSHLTPHTSRLTPHTSHLTPRTHLRPNARLMALSSLRRRCDGWFASANINIRQLLRLGSRRLLLAAITRYAPDSRIRGNTEQHIHGRNCDSCCCCPWVRAASVQASLLNLPPGDCE